MVMTNVASCYERKYANANRFTAAFMDAAFRFE